jgi:excinuclease UvrABC nuclease subunit
MKKAAQRLDFETAAELRDRIALLRESLLTAMSVAD